jgi:hypothetical protein
LFPPREQSEHSARRGLDPASLNARSWNPPRCLHQAQNRDF